MARLVVKVIPRSSENKVSLLADSNERDLLVKIREVPEKGKANKAVIELLSKSLGVSKSSIKVIQGSSSRVKLLDIDVDESKIDLWIKTLN